MMWYQKYNACVVPELLQVVLEISETGIGMDSRNCRLCESHGKKVLNEQRFRWFVGVSKMKW